MITLTINNDTSKPQIAIVGCQHGNEVFGQEVFKLLVTQATELANVVAVIANVEAYRSSKRYIETDLNRSFPGASNGSKEERLAAQILEVIGGADYVIDIHTTTSPEFGAGVISGELTDARKQLISALALERVGIMEPKILATSLIGNTNNGISIEYDIEYLKNHQVAQQILEGIKYLQGLPNSAKPTHQATTYQVTGTIPASTIGNNDYRNYIYNDELQGYPFLVNEKNYTTMNGFLTTNTRTVELATPTNH